MIADKDVIGLYKVAEKRWIDKLLHGEMSFSCPGAFIYQAKQTRNFVQGDLYEGVFARLKLGDARIEETKRLLGSDLETIADGEYLFLRRRSAKFRPIFCIFAYKAEDIFEDNNIKHPGKQAVNFKFDTRMYEGFADMTASKVVAIDRVFTIAVIQPLEFVQRAIAALSGNRIDYKMEYVEYHDIHKGTFFIPLTDTYDELFYKSKEYKYQHEARICIFNRKFSNIYERFNLNTKPYESKDYGIAHDKCVVEMGVKVARIKERP